jgi:aspartyl-tRNA(Asn)/glutamyl-tRNA(Gln) amidotransferase subunit C
MAARLSLAGWRRNGARIAHLRRGVPSNRVPGGRFASLAAMSRITHAEVQNIAALARLSLSETETDEMARDLDRILDYVADLQELDTEGIEPTAHAVPLAVPLREDVAVAAMDPELAGRNAPERAGWAFLVPRVIDGEEG